jgi:exodeoxyribonuclease-5
MEEVLNGEASNCANALLARASELLTQLAVPTDEGISPHELAQTVVRTLAIPEIAALRPRLVPEYTIYGSHTDGATEIIVSGIADAVAYDVEGHIDTVIDWKSDVDITPDRLNSYRGQLETYRRHTSARQAFLVLMTHGKLIAL